MELLQKLTLYDLLGYTLPGTVLLFIYSWSDTTKQLLQTGSFPPGYAFLLIAAGYLTGIILSEIMRLFRKINLNKRNNKNESDLNLDGLPNALKRAHIIQADSALSNLALYRKYSVQIYSDIQTDTKYNRIHNYASAELLYKNMTLVSLLCAPRLAFTGGIVYLMLAVISSVCFCTRWNFFQRRKHEYALYWFLQKYNTQENPSDG